MSGSQRQDHVSWIEVGIFPGDDIQSYCLSPFCREDGGFGLRMAEYFLWSGKEPALNVWRSVCISLRNEFAGRWWDFGVPFGDFPTGTVCLLQHCLKFTSIIEQRVGKQ